MTKGEEAPSSLVALVADRNIEGALRGLLASPEKLSILPVGVEVLVHPHHDPGCVNTAGEILAPLRGQFARAVVIFDRMGCGREGLSRLELEEAVEIQLRRFGWGDAARAVCIDPELESWVWSDSPKVDLALGWSGRQPSLRRWLRDTGLLQAGSRKPREPKLAVERALREIRRPRSSSIYQELAETVSFSRCTDPAFHRLRRLLQEWFPVQAGG